MSETLSYRGSLTVSICWCGMRHAVPSELIDHQERQHRDGRTQTGIYCPLGHSYIISGEGEAERLRKQLERAEQRRKAEQDLREDTERRLSAQKAATTKAKKRAAAALCPCCNRSFVQLRRHIAAKHPDYDPAKA
jgi:hypothetical protein